VYSPNARRLSLSLKVLALLLFVSIHSQAQVKNADSLKKTVQADSLRAQAKIQNDKLNAQYDISDVIHHILHPNKPETPVQKKSGITVTA